MTGGVHTGLGRRATVAIATLVFALVLAAASVAMAQETTSSVTIDDQGLTLSVGGTVFAEKCSPCHGNIANTKNYSSSIEFKHGYHQLVQCSACHSRFPHRPEGTERPTMQACFNCHGLRHGPMGLIASDKCPDCHLEDQSQLRPAFHTADWAEAPHVKPAEEELNTKCMMCHDGPFCDECHVQKDINWTPATGYGYDASGGCLACHGNETLVKTAGGVPKSFQVVGVMNSAHKDITCQQCHIDYKYEEGESPTKLWNVNAAYSCMSCKDHKVANEEYQQSIHAEQIRNGNLDSATCASCHGGHYIQRLDTELAKSVLHASAYRVCARCHKQEWVSYDDYYHGAAYKKGATDAPACWDCHASHAILPSSDPSSTVYPANLGDTCGECHKRSDEDFAAAAGQLIHQKNQAVQSNPLRRLLATVRGWFS